MQPMIDSFAGYAAFQQAQRSLKTIQAETRTVASVSCSKLLEKPQRNTTNNQRGVITCIRLYYKLLQKPWTTEKPVALSALFSARLTNPSYKKPKNRGTNET